jgi:dihydroorotate dehydrogenase electron transfer subunit
LGTGFPLPDGVRNLLLVSDNQVVDPLLGQMERALAAGKAVTLALGGSRMASLYPTARLPAVVEFHAATLDGSLGHRGPVTDLLPELLRWADLVCSVGSIALYRTLKLQAEQVRLKAQEGMLYSLITGATLACGVGACQGCTVETGTGLKLICVDGPVFDLVELV